MKRYAFSLAILALTLCQSALADGYVPYGRLLVSRMPNALFTSTGTTNATNNTTANGETLAAPAVAGPNQNYAAYPFTDSCGCGSGGSPCCDGIWSGYSRSCCRGQKHGGMHRGYGNCGCNSGGGSYGKNSGCGASACDTCGCGGWSGGCFGNSFAGGCGGCGMGLGGHLYNKLHRGFGMGGFGMGCGCSSGCDSGYSNSGGCSGCAGNGNGGGYGNGYGSGYGNSYGNGYSGETLNVPNGNVAPSAPVPTPAAEVAPPVAPATKSALRQYVPRGYMPRSSNW